MENHACASKAAGQGTRPPQSKNLRGTSPEIMIFQYFFLDTFAIFAFSNILEINWPKSEEKLNFGVGGFGCP